MMRSPISIACTVAAVTVAAVAFASPVLGHGGMLRGPTPTLPPGVGPPGTGGPGGGPNTRGGGPTTPGGGGGMGARRRPATPSLTGWETWWEFNKEPYLNLRARLHVGPRTQQAYSDQVLFAEGPDQRVAMAVVVEQILPSLRQCARDSDADVVDSAVLALARMTPPDRSKLVFDDVMAALPNDAPSVRQAALLGLGLLRDERGLAPMIGVLEGSDDGRRALREKGQVDDLLRGFAAVALGLAHNPAAIDPLKRAFARADQDDVKASVLIALGEFGDDADAPPKLVPWLLDLIDDDSSDMVHAQVPIALSRLGECARPALPALVKLLTARRTHEPVRESVAIALGKLAAPEDVEAVAALKDLVETGGDEGASHFALISLGEIGARAAGDLEKHDAVVDDLTRFLYRAISKPVNQHQLPFAATGLALMGQAYRKDAPQRSEFANKIADALGETKNPIHVGALAVALGLLDARVHGPMLLKLLNDTADRPLRGHLAEALGLMGYSDATATLTRMLNDEDDTAYRLQIATGLGLLGDPAVTGILVQRLDRMKTLWETASTAKALGLVGDITAVAPLLKVVENKSRPALTRGFGCVVLGLLGERTRLPWNAHLKYGSNYLVPFRVQSEVLDIL